MKNRLISVALVVVVVALAAVSCGCLGRFFGGDCDATISVAVTGDPAFHNPIADTHVFSYSVTKVRIDTVDNPVVVCDHYKTVTTGYTCSRDATATCPSGYALSRGVCKKSHKPDVAPTYTCPSGYTLLGTDCVKTIDDDHSCPRGDDSTPITEQQCDKSHVEHHYTQAETVTDRSVVTSAQGSPTEIEIGYVTSGSYWRLRWHGRDFVWHEEHWNAPSDENSYVTVVDHALDPAYTAQTPGGFRLTSDQCGQTIAFRYYRVGPQPGTCPSTPCVGDRICVDGQCVEPTPTPTPTPVVCGEGYTNVDNVCVPNGVPIGGGGATGDGLGDGTLSSGYVQWMFHVVTNGTYHGYSWFTSNATEAFITIIRPDGARVGPVHAHPLTTVANGRGGVDASGGAMMLIDEASSPHDVENTQWVVILSGTDAENPVTARVLSADKMFVNDAASPDQYSAAGPRFTTCCHAIYDVWDLRHATIDEIRAYYASNPGVVAISLRLTDGDVVEATGTYCAPSGNCILIR